MKFPHLMQLAEQNQFDTIYHEHFSYFSFHTVRAVFAAHGLDIFDADELSTHGGSLRIYAGHRKDISRSVSDKVAALEKKEILRGMLTPEYYRSFQQKAGEVKYSLVSFLIEQKRAGKKVAAYGAAAKGNTLMNYCGIKKDLIIFVADASPHKQGKYLPGSHIPVVSEETIRETKPDFILILPWNIKDEIMSQLSYIKKWGGKFTVPVPELQII